MQSLFEGSMYTFVFLWTPALQPHGEDIPFGLIFSIFMVACMAGSAVAGKLLAPNSGYVYVGSCNCACWELQLCM